MLYLSCGFLLFFFYFFGQLHAVIICEIKQESGRGQKIVSDSEYWMIIAILEHIEVQSCDDVDVRVHVWTISAAQCDTSLRRLYLTTTSST